MATIGEELRVPEAGWKRYKNSDMAIDYSDNWDWYSDPKSYSGTLVQVKYKNVGEFVQFNFRGTKFRFITLMNASYPGGCITIDGVDYWCEFKRSSTYCALGFEITGLSNKEHSVRITHTLPFEGTTSGLVVDAFDIDEDGELLPYSPIVNPTDPVDPIDPIDPIDPALLHVTMIDSSKREYQLTTKEIDGFIDWYNSISTKEPSYKLTKRIGTSISKEYLAFQKIISFEVK